MGDAETGADETRVRALGSLASAVTYVRMMTDRVLGPGDGSSWLDQVGDADRLQGWTAEDADKAAMLLRVLGEQIRRTRADVGPPGNPQPFSAPQWGGEHPETRPDRLPLNRKERFYTGTVLPMIVALDGFLHLPRFLRLCGLDLVPIGGWRQEGTPAVFPGWLQFFSEYSFAESVFTPKDRVLFDGRPLHADTPDMVIRSEDWLVAVEAKMFHRPSVAALNLQMERQRVLVDYWASRFELPRDRVAHVMLLPDQLRRDRLGVKAPVVTWQQVADEFTGIASQYWLGVLREALARYGELASTENDVSDARLTGQEILDAHQDGTLGYAAMGRQGGLTGQTMQGDLSADGWRAQTYQVRISPTLPNGNWFLVEDFLNRVQTEDTATSSAEHPPAVYPVAPNDTEGPRLLD